MTLWRPAGFRCPCRRHPYVQPAPGATDVWHPEAMPTAQHQVLVSVVMIFRDPQPFFLEAIESVLGQTYPHVELLLCDDGSSDGSTAIARRRADEQPDAVRYLEHDGHAHRGMSSTRNLGVAAARGELIAFLDADDVWEPEHLSHEVALLLAHPEAGLACGQAVDWYSWQDPGREDRSPGLAWPAGVVVPPPKMLVALLRRPDLRTPTCNLLIRKQALDAVGRSEEQFRGMYEDQALLAKLYLSQSCVISGSRTARYRRHDRSSTARAIRAGSYDPTAPNASREAFLRWLGGLPEVADHEASAEVRALVAAALEPYRPGVGRARRQLTSRAGATVRGLVPTEVRRLVRRAGRKARSLAPVRWGSLRRVTPLSRQFGFDRGLPVDRYYVEDFLGRNAHSIVGRVLEVGDSTYTRRFGASSVDQVDVLNIDAGHPETTIVADLARGEQIPSDTFDCLVITQTLHLLYDLPAAVRTLHRVLKPGGTVLATIPGISPLSTDRWAETWYWAVTPLAATRLFGEVFGPENVEVAASGNVLSSIAFLEGLAAGELCRHELEVDDPQFPMLVTVRASRPAPPPPADEPEPYAP
jgi:glycosyltransferase involved in cell wall biosynthesis/SAM-dependent methyltransferase